MEVKYLNMDGKFSKQKKKTNPLQRGIPPKNVSLPD